MGSEAAKMTAASRSFRLVVHGPVAPERHDAKEESDAELVDDEDINHANLVRLHRIVEDGGEEGKEKYRVGVQSPNDLLCEEVVRKP